MATAEKRRRRDRHGRKAGRADFIGRRTQTGDGIIIYGRGVPQGSSYDEEPIRRLRGRGSFLEGS